MISIPLPFVASLLLFILLSLLFVRRNQNSMPLIVFVSLCLLTTVVVGLRWTFDVRLFRLLQPILAACIPITAWYCFSSAYRGYKFSYLNLIIPVCVVICAFTYNWWQPPTDILLVALYFGYGIALILLSYKQKNIPDLVRLSDLDSALKAQRFTGAMLLFSGLIDIFIALNFIFAKGELAPLIVSVSSGVLLPLYTLAIIYFILSIPVSNEAEERKKALSVEGINNKSNNINDATKDINISEAQKILEKIDDVISSQELFLEPDLTLDRLARKTCIPAKKISAVVNQIHGRNISQLINEYRIERAKLLLSTTDKSITDIYLDSGFQTKSNFNREFNRLTQQTPSAFRRSAKSSRV